MAKPPKIGLLRGVSVPRPPMALRPPNSAAATKMLRPSFFTTRGQNLPKA